MATEFASRRHSCARLRAKATFHADRPRIDSRQFAPAQAHISRYGAARTRTDHDLPAARNGGCARLLSPLMADFL